MASLNGLFSLSLSCSLILHPPPPSFFLSPLSIVLAVQINDGFNHLDVILYTSPRNPGASHLVPIFPNSGIPIQPAARGKRKLKKIQQKNRIKLENGVSSLLLTSTLIRHCRLSREPQESGVQCRVSDCVRNSMVASEVLLSLAKGLPLPFTGETSRSWIHFINIISTPVSSYFKFGPSKSSEEETKLQKKPWRKKNNLCL